MLEPQIYLFFKGNCEEAMRFYEKTLGGKLDLMRASEAPDGGGHPADAPDHILHARLGFGQLAIMASDWMSDQPYPGMHGFNISISYPTADEARKMYDALEEGGNAVMPFGETFWVEAFGMVTDRFGTSWMVNGGKPKMP